mmetsp:Transcript_44650/g.39889  ORF Transcript_44650/g.39889 Transcript_44650/m.39889 type:complete len:84 (-) Transcript_44650:126-377(-)
MSCATLQRQKREIVEALGVIGITYIWRQSQQPTVNDVMSQWLESSFRLLSFSFEIVDRELQIRDLQQQRYESIEDGLPEYWQS